MTKFTHFNDKATVAACHAALLETFKKAALELGVSIDGSKLIYDRAGTGELKLTFSLVGTGSPEEKAAVEKRSWDAQCELYGLKPEHFSAQVKIRGNYHGTFTPATLCGFDRKAQKFPVLARTGDGKTWKLRAETVEAQLKLAALGEKV